MNNYFLIFIGLIIGGESVLLPSIYFAWLGKLNTAILNFFAKKNLKKWGMNLCPDYRKS